jgi:hypothetical protein
MGLKIEDGPKQFCYCCLGVLAELVEPEAFEKKGNGFCFHGSPGYLRLPSEEYFLLPKKIQRELASMNDEGDSFPKIADWIEANIEEDAE